MCLKTSMAKRIKSKVIKLPHISYTVVIEQMTKANDIGNADGYTEYVCAEECRMVLKLPIKGPKTASFLVHEIVHVLQNICSGSHMTFENEREHTAYIAGYLFEEICKM